MQEVKKPVLTLVSHTQNIVSVPKPVNKMIEHLEKMGLLMLIRNKSLAMCQSIGGMMDALQLINIYDNLSDEDELLLTYQQRRIVGEVFHSLQLMLPDHHDLEDIRANWMIRTLKRFDSMDFSSWEQQIRAGTYADMLCDYASAKYVGTLRAKKIIANVMQTITKRAHTHGLDNYFGGYLAQNIILLADSSFKGNEFSSVIKALELKKFYETNYQQGSSPPRPLR